MTKTVQYKSKMVLWLSATTVFALGALSVDAFAGGRESLRGPHPWDFRERNREKAFAYQYARDNRRSDRGANGAAAIAGALGGTVIINNSTTAVGNWQQIEMTLGDGAEGLVMTENHQDNSGDSTAGTSILDNAFEAGDWTGDHYSHHHDGGGDHRSAARADDVAAVRDAVQRRRDFSERRSAWGNIEVCANGAACGKSVNQGAEK